MNIFMTRKESIKMAKQIRDSLTHFNDVNDEISLNLYTFEMNGTKFNVFAYIRKEQDEQNHKHKWYSIYAGIEYKDSNNIYADYDNSTEHLRISELSDVLFKLSNMYKDKKYLDKLTHMIKKHA